MCGIFTYQIILFNLFPILVCPAGRECSQEGMGYYLSFGSLIKDETLFLRSRQSSGNKKPDGLHHLGIAVAKKRNPSHGVLLHFSYCHTSLLLLLFGAKVAISR